MIPRFTFFGAGIMPTLAAWELYLLWKARQDGAVIQKDSL
jgi:hypothetical protein